MLSATVEFLLGTFRADPDGTAHTGRLEQGEWPPSPSRLFAALVAADGTRERCRYTDGSELAVLENAAPPIIEAAPTAHHQELQPRYVVKDEGKRTSKQQQEYVARGAALVRPGVRVAPQRATVRYLWSVDPDDAHLRSLQLRAARIGYLGCSDSPVRVRVERVSNSAESASEEMYVPDPVGTVPIGVPEAGRLQLLDAAFDQWVEHGTSVGRSQFPALSTKVNYRPPRSEPVQRVRGQFVASLILRPAVSGRRISAVAAAFKAAVLQRHEVPDSEIAPELHGHGFDGGGYELARFLCLPDVGHAHARGRIHGVALWLPESCDDATVRRARDAVHGISDLYGSGFRASAEVWNGQSRPKAAAPARWARPARRWATAFPAVHERHVALTLEEVCRWCDHAGVPRPVAFRASRSPFLSGAISLEPSEVHRQGRPSRPFSHVELRFDEPVAGPVVLGSGRQRGLGLCFPVGERTAMPVPKGDRD